MITLLLAGLLVVPGVRAQVVSPAGLPPEGYGIAVEGGDWVYRDAADVRRPRHLTAEERGRVSGFFSSLPAEGRDPALMAPLLARSTREGRDPAATGWFEGDAAAPRLTASGRFALTAALLDAKAATAEPARAGAGPETAAAQNARLDAIRGRIAGGADAADFDGASARANAAAVADAVSSPLPPSLRPSANFLAPLPDAPSAKPVPAPKQFSARESIENAAFWSTWWGYHAAWAADFTTTAMILKRGGYETDPLYTRFGNKNMAGVIGSAAAFHAAASIAGVLLHDEAKKHEGAAHYALEAAAILINGSGIGIHSAAAAGNADLLKHWNGR